MAATSILMDPAGSYRETGHFDGFGTILNRYKTPARRLERKVGNPFLAA